MRRHRLWFTSVLVLALAGCGGGVDSEEGAEAAYLGLDAMVGKALNLGFDGFNAASSANIPEQTTTGDLAGTLAVNGQVDQGASDNKEMRLVLTLVGYQDVVLLEDELEVIYDTGDTDPALDLSLRNIPNGTLNGTLVGDFFMQGDLEGVVTMNLTISGELEPDPNDAMMVRRVAGTTRVTGTATSDYGTYDVDVTL